MYNTKNVKDHIGRLKESGEPEIITIDGKAELIVQNATAYQALIDRLEAIEGIRSGLSSMQRNEGRPFDEFFKALTKKHHVTE